MKTENRKMSEILNANIAKLRNAEKVNGSLLASLFERMVTLESRQAVESEWGALTEFAKEKFKVSSLGDVTVLRSAKTLYSQYRKVSEVDGHGAVRKLENNYSLQQRYRAILKAEKEEKAKVEKPGVSQIESAINTFHATCEGLIQQQQTTVEHVVGEILKLQQSLIATTGKAQIRELQKPDEVKDALANKVQRENALAAQG